MPTTPWTSRSCQNAHALHDALLKSFVASLLPCRLTKVVAEGKGKKGADAALRAAAVGMADKAVGVRVGVKSRDACCMGLRLGSWAPPQHDASLPGNELPVVAEAAPLMSHACPYPLSRHAMLNLNLRLSSAGCGRCPAERADWAAGPGRVGGRRRPAGQRRQEAGNGGTYQGAGWPRQRQLSSGSRCCRSCSRPLPPRHSCRTGRSLPRRRRQPTWHGAASGGRPCGSCGGSSGGARGRRPHPCIQRRQG